MGKSCENCGCRLNSGICSNCHEETYIATFQADCIEGPLSKEFTDKMKEQKREIKENRRKEES